MTAQVSFGAIRCHARDEFITPMLLARGVWEPAETAYLQWRLRPGATFVDVGAHVGYFSLLASRCVGPSGHVLAFEPDPDNFALLCENVRGNRCHNVSVFPYAVGEHSGRVDLHRAEHNTGDHRIYACEEQRPIVNVPCVALDDLVRLRPPLDVVKVDVQGAEAAVLHGMRGLVESSPGLVAVIEYWPLGLTRFGTESEDLLDLCRALGFALEVQYPDRPFPRPFDPVEVGEFCALEAGAVNLVLTRSPARPARRVRTQVPPRTASAGRSGHRSRALCPADSGAAE